jgi:hypothetical protein
MLGAILRFARLEDATWWLGDQARDATIVMRSVTSGNVPALGPPASTLTFARAPGYYILLMPWYWLTNGDPVSGAMFVAALDVATIALLFVVVRRWTGALGGLTAALLWAVSPVVVVWARLAWNPDIVPFFTMLCVFAMTRCLTDGRWLAVAAAAFSLAWQCHDEALLLVPPFAVIVATHLRTYRVWHLAAAPVAVALSLWPFLTYELTHGWPNVLGMADYILRGSVLSGFRNTLAWPDRIGAAATGALSILPDVPARLPLVLLVGVGLSLAAWQAWHRRGASELVIVAWAAILPLYGFWRGAFDTYYLTVLLPLVALLLGGGVAAIQRLGRVPGAAAFLVVGACLCLTGASTFRVVTEAPLNSGSLATTRAVVELVRREAKGQPFAFRLVSYAAGTDSYAAPYGYLLARGGPRPERRVDVPTFVAFDPPPVDRPADAIVNGVGIVAFAAPTLGENVATGLLDATSGWEIPDGVQVGSDGASTWFSIPGTPNGPLNENGVNVARTIPVLPARRYVLSFAARNAQAGGVDRVYGQVLDASGAAIATFPDGGGYGIDPSNTWTTGSFYVEVPDSGVAVRVYLRNAGRPPVDIGDVQVRPIEGQAVPGEAVTAW